MKIGCCAGPYHWGDDLPGFFARMKEAGFDYAEASLADIVQLEEAAFADFLEQTRRAAIPIECCCILFPGDRIKVTGEHVDIRQIRTYLEKAFERAALLSVKIVVFGSGGAKNIPEGFDYQRALEQYRETLAVLSELAMRYGITVALEHLNRKEANFIMSIREVVDILRGGEYPGIGLLVDYYHMKTEREDESILCEVGDILCHTHIADPDGRTFPREENRTQYQAFFKRLKEIGYDARVSVEAGSSDVIADGKMSVPLLRQILSL